MHFHFSDFEINEEDTTRYWNKMSKPVTSIEQGFPLLNIVYKIKNETFIENNVHQSI
jgi:protein tyrosine phosphatase